MTRIKMILIFICVFLVSCSDRDVQNDKKLDPLHYRKEIAALNLEFTTEEYFRQIERGDEIVVDLFLKAGMSPNEELSIGNGLMKFTPLITSVKEKQYDVTLLLLKAGGDPNKLVNQENGSGRGNTPVTLAIELIDSKSLRLLLDNKGDTSAGGNKGIFKSVVSNMHKYMGKPGHGGLEDLYAIFEMLEKHEQNRAEPDKESLKIYSVQLDNLNAMITKLCSDKDKYLLNKSESVQDAQATSFIISKCE